MRRPTRTRRLDGGAARREATQTDLALLREMSNGFEALTGRQGYLYCTVPTPRSERFVFGDGHTVIGIENALGKMRTMVAEHYAQAPGDQDRA